MSKLQARNELVVNAPIDRVWALITDIKQLHLVNPGVVSAHGTMNQLNGTRTCEMSNNGKKGTMTERLIELEPFRKTVWTVVEDSMGMSKMLNNTRFCFYLEKVSEHRTKIINESYYQPATIFASVLNALMMKRTMGKIHGQILSNIQTVLSK